MPQSISSNVPRYFDNSTVMAQKYTYHTKEYFWGETFYTDRRLSVISDTSMPGMVEDHSEDSETSGDEFSSSSTQFQGSDYHLSSTKLFDSYHDTPLRAASTLLTQVNRTYARENHQYPTFPNFPPSRSGARRSVRRSSNVLQTLESSPDDPRPTARFYGTWPLRNDSNQVACNNRLSVPLRTSSQRPNTEPRSFSLPSSPGIAPTSTAHGPPKPIEAANQEKSYFEHSDDEESGDEDSSGSLTGKAMKRLHIRSPSASKIGDMKRRFFRTSKKL